MAYIQEQNEEGELNKICVNTRFIPEEIDLLLQIENMQEEKDASEIFRKDLLQLSVEMIKKSKEKYDLEVIKNKALERKLENLN